MDKSEISDKPLGTHIQSCSVWFSGQLPFLLLCINYVSPCLTWIHYVKQIHVVKLGKKKKKIYTVISYQSWATITDFWAQCYITEQVGREWSKLDKDNAVDLHYINVAKLNVPQQI